MHDANAIKQALRRQAEAKAAQKDRLARLERSEPDGRTIDELWADINKDANLCPQIEGFVLGWLAATGQFDDYAELAAIWLDTPKEAGESISDGADIVDPMQRFSVRLKLPAGSMGRAYKEGRSHG